jgi:hypothetical protein
MIKSPIAKKAMTDVCEWNNKHKVGIPVIVTKDDGSEITTVTKTEAMILGGHTPIIYLENIRGCYDLKRVRAL